MPLLDAWRAWLAETRQDRRNLPAALAELDAHRKQQHDTLMLPVDHRMGELTDPRDIAQDGRW